MRSPNFWPLTYSRHPTSPGDEQRLADLWAMLRTERALIAELEEEKRKVRTGGPEHETIEAALAKIRRRIAEIEDTR